MDKILLITEKEEHDESLIECLKSLFPECEIEIHSKQPDVNYCLSQQEELVSEGKLDERLNKLISLL